MRELRITVPVDGSGNGSAQSEQAMYGTIRHIGVAYNGQSATANVTITEVGMLGKTLLTRTATNTGGTFTPGTQMTDGAGAAIAGAFVQPAIAGKVQVTVSGGTSNAAGVVVVVQVQEES